MAVTFRKQGPQLIAADVTRSCVEVARSSPEPQHEVLCTSMASLKNEVSQLQWNGICLESHCAIKAWCSRRTRAFLDGEYETN